MIVFVFIWSVLAGFMAQGEESTQVDDGVRISVLGYHVFSAEKEPTAMRIRTVDFRAQMERIQDSGIPVISLPQFLAWRRGEETLPAQCFLITMDDGWHSVYTEAWPVLREMKLPFTIYLYKNYVGSDKGGRALSLEMIREMMGSGLCTIGSHSVSHPLPSRVKAQAKNGSDHFETYLRRELGESKTFLEKTFEVPVTTYAYPGGYHTPEMHQLADEFGYDHLFTVLPGKVRRDSPRHRLPRYIVLGNHDGAFEAAMTFRNTSRTMATEITLPHPVLPGPGHLVSSRTPEISVDLSGVEKLDVGSVIMKVGGFGQVPIRYNPNTKTVSWVVSRTLRQPVCEVNVQWKQKGQTRYEPGMKWSFRIDQEAHYQPQ